MNEMKNFRKSWKGKNLILVSLKVKSRVKGDLDSDKETKEIYMRMMEMSLRIITTTIILLWSIQTYKCTEGFKPGTMMEAQLNFLYLLCLEYFCYRQFSLRNAIQKVFQFFTQLHSFFALLLCAQFSFRDHSEFL